VNDPSAMSWTALVEEPRTLRKRVRELHARVATGGPIPAALQSDPDRLLEILRSCPELILLYDQRHACLHPSQTAVEYLGAFDPRWAQCGTRASPGCLPDSQDPWPDAIDRAFAERQAFRARDAASGSRATGESGPLVVPFCDAHGQTYAVGIIPDPSADGVSPEDTEEAEACPGTSPIPSDDARMAAELRALRCLCSVTELIARSTSVTSLLADLVASLPACWPSGDAVSVQISFDGALYSAREGKAAPWILRRAILVDGRSRGAVEFHMLESRLAAPWAGCQPEDELLLDGIACAVGEGVARCEAGERAKRRGAVLRVMRGTTRIAERVTDRGEFIQAVCDRLAGDRGYVAVWIALLENDAPTAVAAAGVPDLIAQLRSRIERGLLPTCARRALHSGEVHNVRGSPEDCGDCPLALASVPSCGLAVRISVEGQCHGVLGASLAQGGPLELEEGFLLREVAADVALALRSLDRAQQRRISEEELRKSEFRFRRLHTSMRDAFVQVDMSGRITDWNAAYQEMLGYTAEDLPRLTNEDLTPQRWHAFESDVVTKEVLPNGQSRVYEKEYIRKDGTVIPVELRTFLIRGEDGSPEAMWAIVRDITDRKRALDRLRRSQVELRLRNRIARVFLTVPDDGMYAAVLAIILKAMRSPFGVFGFIANDGSLVVPTMTAGVWDRCQVSDKSPVFPKETWGSSTWPAAIRERRVVHSNAPSTNTPPGHIQIVRHISLPIIHGEASIGLIQVANKPTDYTSEDIRQLEIIGRMIAPVLQARLQLDRQDLARRVVERKLREAVEDLNRSNRELEQFAYVASHDLQEPLRMVSSYTQMLAERYGEQLDDKAKLYIHYAVDGAVRMQQLINDLLAFSRVTARGAPTERVDSHAALGQALTALTMSIQESGAVVTNDDLPLVHADAIQLAQVFQNLVSNGIMFHGAAPPHVHVSAEREGDFWVFSVQDNGIGIDGRYQEKIFGLFQRLHTREEYPGTGIGLALCKRIVERHGGRIWFDSEPGHGTTFRFTIPAGTSDGGESR
jgi:PAS domain S-box-containing protein